MNAGRSLAAAYLFLMLCAAAGRTAVPTPPNAGEAIYLQGVTGSGAPIEARRGGATRSQGVEVACVKCHRRSGLGVSTGFGGKDRGVIIPPITGQYLFHSRDAPFGEAALPFVQNARSNRSTYTDVALARAIRTGIDPDGKTLSYLMPRFALSDADMASLSAYLKALGQGEVPGVTAKVLHFATIVTPDADAVKRAGMLDVIEHFFADKNTFPFPPSPPMRSSGKTLYAKSMYMANRHWQLHVWELSGPSDGWAQQLAQHLKAEPVMAAVSGLGGSEWAPVHQFCQRAHLPCLFPNVEVPVVADEDFYTLYFSRGVLLEADLIVGRISAAGGPPVKSVRQVYRSGDSGAPAAQALATALEQRGLTVHSEALAPSESAPRLNEAVRAAGADALVLWLRPKDIASLGAPEAAPARVYLSGLLGGLEHTPLPAAWRSRTLMTYPFDLPDRSRVRVNYPLQWFSIRHIPLVAEQVQIDTFLACGVLAETLSHLSDTFARDYIVERAESMIEHRLMTGPYPRLTLAEGQRFASKGGYLVQFAGADGALKADGEWTIPE